MSIDYVQIMDVSFKTNYTGVLWVDMSLLPFGRSYADVLVCDCPEQYNRPFTFNIGSDTPGTLEISDINVSYDALISYDSDGVTPTSSIETDKFSWVAINSRITDSSMGYQSGLYNSTVDNSELILSSLTCYNVTNSELVIALMGGNTGLLPPGPCANEIRDSKLDFVMMLGGSVVNSTLIGIPIMAFTDFQDAHVENLTLYQGNMILNGTRFPNFFNQSQDIGGVFSLLGTNSFPLGCSEDSFFVVDSVLDLSLGGLNAGTINCRFKVLNSNFTIYNITFQNEFGGFRGELKGSNLFVRDMPGPTNIALFGGETDIIFYGVNTSDYGTLLFSSNDIHVDNGFASINGSANGGQLAQLASDVQTTLVFYNIDDFDGHITYYENFTTNETEAVERGIPCPSSVCSNLRYNSAERTVTVDVNNFSTYVLNYTPLPPVPDNGGSDRDLAISVAGTCLREQVQFNATSGASRVSGVDITLYYPVSGFSHIHTGAGGTAAFIPTQAGTYRFSAYASGYRQVDGTFSEEECAPQVPPVQNETVAPTPPAQETPEEETGGTVAPGQPPAQPPEQVEVPAQPPAQPPQEGTPSEQPEQLPPTTQAQSCCFLFCAQIFGICWYWWLIILIIIIAGAYQLSKSLAK
jgi:hypothetical protein